MFFSTATRPTQRKIGRGSSHSSRGSGLNRSRSTPRDHGRILRNPRAASSSRNDCVATMVPCAAPWNRRIQAYTGRTGRPVRALTYSAKRVWNAVVKPNPVRFAQLRAAMPERPLGRDVHRLRLERLDHAHQRSGAAAATAECRCRSGTGWCGTGRAQITSTTWPIARSSADHRGQRAHHAVHLRQPRIGNDHDPVRGRGRQHRVAAGWVFEGE